jgi:hypothetical protein
MEAPGSPARLDDLPGAAIEGEDEGSFAFTSAASQVSSAASPFQGRGERELPLPRAADATDVSLASSNLA